jgi:ketosteroid isomerase-like protein
MKRHLCLLFLSAALFAASPQDAIKQAEKDWAKGITSNDLALLQAVLADDLIYTHSDGVVDTKAGYIDKIRSGKLKYVVCDHEQMDVRLYTSFALLTARVSVKAISDGNEVNNKLALLHVYVKRKGKWEMVAHQSARLAK